VQAHLGTDQPAGAGDERFLSHKGTVYSMGGYPLTGRQAH
jgi:hypothetical protein